MPSADFETPISGATCRNVARTCCPSSPRGRAVAQQPRSTPLRRTGVRAGRAQPIFISLSKWYSST